MNSWTEVKNLQRGTAIEWRGNTIRVLNIWYDTKSKMYHIEFWRNPTLVVPGSMKVRLANEL